MSGEVGGVLVALAEAHLGQVNAFNALEEITTIKLDWIQNSLHENNGVVRFNQSAGHRNHQANIVPVAFAHERR